MDSNICVKLYQMSKKNDKVINASLGTLIDWDPVKSSLGLRRNYLRLRVKNNFIETLKKEMWISRGAVICYKAMLKCKRLSDFCFNRGILGRLFRQCSEKIRSNEGFGPSLRA